MAATLYVSRNTVKTHLRPAAPPAGDLDSTEERAGRCPLTFTAAMQFTWGG